ncbi:MAG: hypothetical protein OHK0057_14520 [Thermoflexibacter sp.]
MAGENTKILLNYCKNLKKDIPDGKQEIGNFIAELKVKYAKRPAMIEELNKIK